MIAVVNYFSRPLSVSMLMLVSMSLQRLTMHTSLLLAY